MTQDTKILLREIAIIHVKLNLVLEQQKLIADALTQNLILPEQIQDIQIEEEVEIIKIRLANNHNIQNSTF